MDELPHFQQEWGISIFMYHFADFSIGFCESISLLPGCDSEDS